MCHIPVLIAAFATHGTMNQYRIELRFHITLLSHQTDSSKIDHPIPLVPYIYGSKLLASEIGQGPHIG